MLSAEKIKSNIHADGQGWRIRLALEVKCSRQAMEVRTRLHAPSAVDDEVRVALKRLWAEIYGGELENKVQGILLSACKIQPRAPKLEERIHEVLKMLRDPQWKDPVNEVNAMNGKLL